MKRILLLTLWILTSVPGVLPAAEKLQLFVGEARVVPVNAPKKVAVGDPKVADVQVLSEKEILLSGKTAGSTSLIIWTSDGTKESTEVAVTAGSQERTMVEINVQMLEISRKNMLDLGIDWPSVLEGKVIPPAKDLLTGKEVQTVFSPASPLHVAEQTNPPLLSWGSFQRGNLDATINAMVQRGTAKVLAKPKLLAVSGTAASFLAGGEIPIVNQDLNGRTTVTWKPYGVTLDIEPVADPQGNVNALIRAEVSNLDPANAVHLPNGTYMPAIRTRWARTNVFVKKGGTIVMAGLIQNEELHSTAGVPFLSDIPFFGEIFKAHHTEDLSTEMVVFVTPSVVGMR